MVDFSKLGKKPRIVIMYTCQKCGDATEYIIELPEHMLTHTGPAKGSYTLRWCKGKLVETSRREESR